MFIFQGMELTYLLFSSMKFSILEPGYLIEFKEIVERNLVPFSQFLIAGKQEGQRSLVNTCVIAQVLATQPQAFHFGLDTFNG